MSYPISVQEFRERRKRLISQQVLSGVSTFSIAIVSNFEQQSSEATLFTQDVDFFYLTGITQPGSILFFEVKQKQVRETLWRPTRPSASTSIAPWARQLNRRQIPDFKVKSSGNLPQGWVTVDCTGYDHFFAMLRQRELLNPLFVNANENRLSGVWLRRYLPAALSCSTAIHLLRQHKSQAEIRLLRVATQISEESHSPVVKQHQVNETDQAIQAEYVRAFVAKGAEPAYYPIVLVGKKGRVLHGIADGTVWTSGQLLLCDVAASYQGYHSDVTRTFAPKWSPEQKQAYEKVVQALHFAVSCARPGVFIYRGADSIQNRLLHWIQAQKTWDAETKEALLKHGIGHHVGLETHDPEIGPLAVNNVIALETGYYLGAINIRVENIYLITSEGAKQLTTIT